MRNKKLIDKRNDKPFSLAFYLFCPSLLLVSVVTQHLDSPCQEGFGAHSEALKFRFNFKTRPRL